MNQVKAFLGNPIMPGDYEATLETLEDYRELYKTARAGIGDRDIILKDAWVVNKSHSSVSILLESLDDVKDFLKIRALSNTSNGVKYAVIKETNTLAEAYNILSESEEELIYVEGGQTKEELAKQISYNNPDIDLLEAEGWNFCPELNVAWK